MVNCYAEPLGETAGSRAVWRRVPGLTNFGTTTRSGCRGSILIDGVLYTAFSGQLEKHTSSGGSSSNVGALNGSKKGFFARNNATTPDKVFVDPDGNIATFTPTSVTNSYPDADLPAVNSVASIDGYLVFTTGSGKAYATDLNSTAVNALSFGTAEAKPDGLTRAVAWSGLLFLMGAFTTEIWTDQGLSPFPFGRSTVIPRGIAGPYCVAGHEDNFSKALIWVGDDNCIHRLSGYTTEKISPPDLDALIEAVEDKDDLEACVYISRGHACWQLSSSTWTWVFDLNTEKWHERDSYGEGRSRITTTINSFGKWLAGDTASGDLQEITNSVHQEVGDPLRWRIESGPVGKFPSATRVGRADFRFVTGVGMASGSDPIQTDPTVEISWSDDGGVTWTVPLVRKLGRQSSTEQIVSVIGAGRTRWQGRRWRLDVFDPVHVGFMGGAMSESARA